MSQAYVAMCTNLNNNDKEKIQQLKHTGEPQVISQVRLFSQGFFQTVTLRI